MNRSIFQLLKTSIIKDDSSLKKITTFLIFNRDDTLWTYRTVKYYVTVGNGTSYSTNPKCVDLGSI